MSRLTQLSPKIHGLFSNRLIGTYAPHTKKQATAILEEGLAQQAQWRKLSLPERAAYITAFQQQLQTNDSRTEMVNLLSECSGKQLSECEAEVRVALKILRSQIGYPYHLREKVDNDHYRLEPFDSTLSVFDHRHPILSACQYLGISLQSRNPLLLRPSPLVLPAVDFISQTWAKTCPIKMVQTIIDSHINPAHPDSPVDVLLRQAQGFVNFSGRLKAGFDFHYALANRNDLFRENELLLTSSDSAYVLKDLNALQLKKAAEIVARGSFSNCGHNFNSIKRLFLDKEIADSFIGLLLEESKKYQPHPTLLQKPSEATINPGMLAPYLIHQEFIQAQTQLQELTSKHNEELKLLAGGESIEVETETRKIGFITPAIFQVTSDFPQYNYQNEQFMMPIVFISIVESQAACIEKINSSIMGITSSLFTGDNSLSAVESIGRRLDVGTVNVNTWEVTDGITYSGRKRSGKGFSFSPLSFNNAVRTKAVSYQ